MPAIEENQQHFMNSSVRLKREEELSLKEKGEICSELELQQKSTDIAANIIGDISSLPIVGKIVGTMAAAMMAIAHVGSGALDIQQTLLGCSDLPFDEIKQILEEKFNELDRKLDSHSEALKEVTKLVEKTLSSIEKTRKQMNKRFDEVLESIKNTNIAPIVSKINNFGKYFDTEAERIRGLRLNDYVAKLEEPNGILVYLRDSRTPKGDSLHAPLLTIINEEYAIPTSINDELAFKALDALLYGAQTYVSVMFFLLEQYSFLANYYYEKGEIETYNQYFDNINNIFLDFKSSLVGSGASSSEPLIDKILQVLNVVKSRELQNEVIDMLNEKISLFNEIKEDIDGRQKMTISETPENYVQISFEKDIPTPFGDWRERKEVRYAVQYESETLFSKVSHWTDPITVRERACPTLRMPTDQHRKTILVFRKFDNSKSQLVGSVSPYQSNFIDIDRDLYNAARNPDIDVGHREVIKLFGNDANFKASFEHGRTALHAAAESGNARVMYAFLLMSSSSDINKPDKKGFTAIHVAADRGNSGIVKLLLDFNASVNLKTNRALQTPLHLAARRGFIAVFDKLMESPEININEKDIDGFTPLHNAVIGGKKIVDAFIKQARTDINAKSEKGLTPFHLAIINDDWPVAQILLTSESLQVNAGDKSNMTPLHYAAMLGHLETTRNLMKLSSVNVNAVSTPTLWTALHYAIFFKRDDVTLELLKSPEVDKDLSSLGGITPLHLAVTVGRKEVVMEMIRIGIDIEQKTLEGFTPLHLAAVSKYPEIVTILIQQGSNIDSKTISGATPLLLATLRGRAQASMILLNNEVNYKAVDNDGKMPIHGAAMNGLLDIAKDIINLDPSIIDVKNNNLDTPLNLAAQYLQTEMVKYLVDHRADINTKNKQGNAPLLSFSKVGNSEMVKFLIRNGADVYIADNNGMNFFYYAAQNGHLNIIKYAMSENKFNWSNIDNNRRKGCADECAISHFAICDAIQYGKQNVVEYFVGTLGHFSICSPLHQAAMYGQLHIVKYLVETALLNVDGTKSDTPLCYASKKGYLEIVKYLVDNGAEINRDCANGETAIDMAISNKHIDVVKFLVKRGADLKRKNLLGSTPLLTAVASNSIEIARYFITEKIRDLLLNEQNGNGESVLHLAVFHNNLQMVTFLVLQGVDVGIQDTNGKTALDIARDANFSRIVEYLKDKSKRFRKGFKIRNSPQDFLYESMTSNFIGRKNIEQDYQKLINADVEATKTFSNSLPLQNFDFIGTIMLIDVLIKYVTKQGYVNKETDSALDDGAQAAALEITEKFEDLLNVYHDSPDELVDFAEVHKKVYAAIKSGNKSKINQVLCSFLKSVSALELEENETLMSKLLNFQSSISVPEVSSSTVEAYGNTLHLLGEFCLKSEWSPSLMLT